MSQVPVLSMERNRSTEGMIDPAAETQNRSGGSRLERANFSSPSAMTVYRD